MVGIYGCFADLPRKIEKNAARCCCSAESFPNAAPKMLNNNMVVLDTQVGHLVNIPSINPTFRTTISGDDKISPRRGHVLVKNKLGRVDACARRGMLLGGYSARSWCVP
jgi:hypothetical protein